MKVKALNISLVIFALIAAVFFIVPLIAYKQSKFVNFTSTADDETHLESYGSATQTDFGLFMLKYWAAIFSSKGKVETKSITSDDGF